MKCSQENPVPLIITPVASVREVLENEDADAKKEELAETPGNIEKTPAKRRTNIKKSASRKGTKTGGKKATKTSKKSVVGAKSDKKRKSSRLAKKEGNATTSGAV